MCLLVNVADISKVYVNYYYHGVTAKILKTESLVEDQITNMKYIKIHSCYVGVILTKKHMKWQM